MLLDTHAAVWIADGTRIAAAAVRTVEAAILTRSVLFSAVSAWEIGILVAKGRLTLAVSPERWVAGLLDGPGVMGIPLDIEAALESYRLPGEFHPDPADRLLVAQARVLGACLVTRDRRILQYAEAGYVRAVAC